MAVVTHAATNDNTPVRIRLERLHRLLLMATYAMHFISSAIVLAIAAYFMSVVGENYSTHLIYWTIVAVIGSAIYLPAIAAPAIKSYKGYFAPLTFIFACLWLTAFVFAAQDLGHGSCSSDMSELASIATVCRLVKTLETFTFIAFMTCVIGALLEARLWYSQRHKPAYYTDTFDADKNYVDTLNAGKHQAGHIPTTTPIVNAAGAACFSSC